MAPHSSTLAWKIPLSCLGEGNGNPLQCSCLENPRDGGAWWAAVYGVTQSRTRLKWLGGSSSILCSLKLVPLDTKVTHLQRHASITHKLENHFPVLHPSSSPWLLHNICSRESVFIWQLEQDIKENLDLTTNWEYNLFSAETNMAPIYMLS